MGEYLIMDKHLEDMAAIMARKDQEMQAGPPPLDAEKRAVAETKRKTFDLPTNAVKVDPLR